MATAAFWQRGETIDRINDTAKTIPANTRLSVRESES